ncbi:unnamed protein product [Mytilus edulis]|uniref:Uncharacterized protein n=1 Tax=Mytilus edulis TaxID=6550 RepID=A0A8S3RYL6_MYTED|nr:unnamed protein product [Mytilus edulis]
MSFQPTSSTPNEEWTNTDLRRRLWTRETPSYIGESVNDEATIQWRHPEMDELWSAHTALQDRVNSLIRELKRETRKNKKYVRPEVFILNRKEADALRKFIAIANFPKSEQALISDELKKVNGVDKLFTPHDDISENFTLVIPSKLNIGPSHAKKLAESQKKMLEQALTIPSNGTVSIEIFARPKPSLKRQRKRRFKRPPQLETEISQPRGDKQYLTPIHKNLPL